MLEWIKICNRLKKISKTMKKKKNNVDVVNCTWIEINLAGGWEKTNKEGRKKSKVKKEKLKKRVKVC